MAEILLSAPLSADVGNALGGQSGLIRFVVAPESPFCALDPRLLQGRMWGLLCSETTDL